MSGAMTGRLLSLNVGGPRDVAWEGRTVRTAIWKEPVDGPRMVRRINIDGDVGVEVEALRVTGRRPVASLLGFVADRRPALVVLATDPAALRLVRRPTRRRYRQFVAALAAHATCLMWTAQAPAAGAAGA